MTDTEHNSSETTSPEHTPSHRKPGVWNTVLIIVLWIVGITAIAAVILLNTKAADPVIRQIANLGRTVTPTSTPTLLPTATLTPTPSPTPTDVPLSTETALPESKFYVPDMGQVDPSIPNVTGPGYILNDDTAATPDPPFDGGGWISSSQIAEQLNSSISESFYATFGKASVTWAMDNPVQPGYYELYVMDTVYSSAGTLDFTIAVNGQPVFPLYGSSTVEFESSRGESPQTYDKWRSLGIYHLDTPGVFSISAAWGKRDERSIVAVDRIAIVPYPTSNGRMIEALPKDYQITFVDDSSAVVKSSQVIYPETTDLAWFDSYQFLVNPESDSTVTWSPADTLPIGQYQVAVWLPKMHSSGEVNYELSVNGEVVPNDQTGGPVTLDQSSGAGQWVSLGTWTTPHIYEKPVQLALKMTAAAGSKGEFSLDAVAFIKMP
jgi:hypothetical protein